MNRIPTNDLNSNFSEFFSELNETAYQEADDFGLIGEADFDTEFSDFQFPEYFSESGRNIYPENITGNADWETLAEYNVGPRELARLTLDGFESLTDPEVDEALESILHTMSDAEIESFWRGLARFGAKIVKPLAQWGGTALGTVIGGPVGAAVGNVAGRALGNLAQRGLSRAGRPRRRPQARRRRRVRSQGRFRGQPRSGPSRRTISQRVRRNIHQGATRIRRGQPLFNQQQMSHAVRRVQGVLASPAVQRSLSNSYGDEVIETENMFGEYYPSDLALAGTAETILELAADIEELLPENTDIDFDQFDHWADFS